MKAYKRALTKEQIDKIRRLHSEGLNMVQLAERFSLSTSYVYYILNTRTSHQSVPPDKG